LCFRLNDDFVGVAEIKTFWNLTERSIDEVLQGFLSLLPAQLINLDLAPLSGDHHGRLAVEQAYGYMVHNHVVYGLITTVNAFAFLCRANGGELKITRLIPAVTSNPTALQMLYYMSYLCAQTPLLYETKNDGTLVYISKVNKDQTRATLIPPPSMPQQRPSHDSDIDPSNSSPRRSPRLQQRESKMNPIIRTYASKDLRLDINVRAPGTWLGCKGYKGILDTGETVFAKLWDGWKYSSKESEREAQIYMELKSLWGTVVPRMIAHGGWGFCHILLLDFVEVWLFLPTPHPLFVLLTVLGENVIDGRSTSHFGSEYYCRL
jgi:hypothetical protein